MVSIRDHISTKLSSNPLVSCHMSWYSFASLTEVNEEQGRIFFCQQKAVPSAFSCYWIVSLCNVNIFVIVNFCADYSSAVSLLAGLPDLIMSWCPSCAPPWWRAPFPAAPAHAPPAAFLLDFPLPVNVLRHPSMPRWIYPRHRWYLSPSPPVTGQMSPVLVPGIVRTGNITNRELQGTGLSLQLCTSHRLRGRSSTSGFCDCLLAATYTDATRSTVTWTHGWTRPAGHFDVEEAHVGEPSWRHHTIHGIRKELFS